MWTKTNLLCEIGTEEIPAGYIPGAIEYLKKNFSERLNSERIDFSGVEIFATPRRLIVCGVEVGKDQRDETRPNRRRLSRLRLGGHGQYRVQIHKFGVFTIK